MPKKIDEKFEQMADALKVINHNTTSLASSGEKAALSLEKLSDGFLIHSTKVETNMELIGNTLEKYWKILIVMLGILCTIAGSLGIKIAFF